MYLNELNNGNDDFVEIELLRCCGSRKWAKKVLAARPFSSIKNLKSVAIKIWFELNKDDYLEAFSAHPKIGENKYSKESKITETWSRKEQVAMIKASKLQ